MSSAEKITILLADEDALRRDGLAAVLQGGAHYEVVAQCPDGEAALRQIREIRPDVAVVDLNLPGLSGLEVCRRIRQRDEDAKIIIFTMNDDPVFAARAIEAGAKGYIAKNDDPSLFVDAVRQVARGGVYLHPDMARQIAFLRSNAHSSKVSALNPRELEILRMLAAGRSMGDIADALHVSYKTVANNCTALKQKLGARSSMDLMRIAMETSGA